MVEKVAHLPAVQEMLRTATDVLGYDIREVFFTGGAESSIRCSSKMAIASTTPFTANRPCCLLGSAMCVSHARLAAIEKLRAENPDAVRRWPLLQPTHV
jgi:hypothetical protein